MCNEDYPIGGSIEPYDIWREKELLEQEERSNINNNSNENEKRK